MSEFLLFSAPPYYPYGGMADCVGRFASKEETDTAALDAHQKRREQRNYSIYDTHALQIPEMVVRIYDNAGRYEGVVTLNAFMEDKET